MEGDGAQQAQTSEEESLSSILTQCATTLRSEVRVPRSQKEHPLFSEDEDDDTDTQGKDSHSGARATRKELESQNESLRKQLKQMQEQKDKQLKGDAGKAKKRKVSSSKTVTKAKAKRGRSHSRRRQRSRSRSRSRGSSLPARISPPGEDPTSPSPSRSESSDESSDDDSEGSSPSLQPPRRRKRQQYRERFSVSNVKLENFSGSEKEDAESWLIRAERILRAGTRHKSRYVGFISLRLRGSASTWFNQLDHALLKDYDSFRVFFLATFQKESTATHGATLRALDKIRQLAGETLSHYYIRFKKGIADLQRYDPVGRVTIVHRYIAGLRKEYRNKAAWYERKNEFLTAKELHKKMIIWELHAREQFRADNIPLFNAVPPIETTTTTTATTAPTAQAPQLRTEPSIRDVLLSLKKEITDLRNQVNRGGRRRNARNAWVPEWTDTGEPICSFCKGVGHMRKACPRRKETPPSSARQDRYCEYHQVFGHRTDECRAKKSEDGKTARTTNAVQQPPTILRLPAPPAQAMSAAMSDSDSAAQQLGFRQPTLE